LSQSIDEIIQAIKLRGTVTCEERSLLFEEIPEAYKEIEAAQEER
jgi:hypothetical protein